MYTTFVIHEILINWFRIQDPAWPGPFIHDIDFKFVSGRKVAMESNNIIQGCLRVIN